MTSRDQGTVRAITFSYLRCSGFLQVDVLYSHPAKDSLRIQHAREYRSYRVVNTGKASISIDAKVARVINESHLHAGHMAMRDLPREQRLETHFNVKIVSDAFTRNANAKASDGLWHS